MFLGEFDFKENARRDMIGSVLYEVGFINNLAGWKETIILSYIMNIRGYDKKGMG